MTKSTISFRKATTGYQILQGRKVLFTYSTRKEARQALRQARAAERTAAAFLKGTEASNEGRTACDIRCTSAVGVLCSCACMGANHGEGALVAA